MSHLDPTREQAMMTMARRIDAALEAWNAEQTDPASEAAALWRLSVRAQRLSSMAEAYERWIRAQVSA